MSVQYLGAALASGAPAREVVQAYVAVPRVAGLVTPAAKLCAFAVVELAAGAAATSVSFVVAPYDISTVSLSGERSVTGGEYTFSLSGHAPMDAQGAARASNAVSVTVTVD